MKNDRILAAAFVVLVSTAIVGFSAGSTGASFTGSSTNPDQSLLTATVLPPASQGVPVSGPAGVVNLSWTATPTAPNGHTLTYLVLRNGVQIASTSGLSYSDTPPADGSYSYTIQTKLAQGAGFFTSADSAAQTGISDRTAPTNATGLAAVTGTTTGTVNLTWTAGSDATSGLAGYTIHRSGVVATCPATTAANYPTTVTVGAVTSTTVGGMTSNSKYCFYITATDNAGNVSGASAAAGPTKAK